MTTHDNVLRDGVGTAHDGTRKEVVERVFGHTIEIEDHRVKLALALSTVRPTKVGTARNESPVIGAKLFEGISKRVLK